MNKKTQKNNLYRTSYLIKKNTKKQIYRGGSGSLIKIPSLILYNYKNPGSQVMSNNKSNPVKDVNLKTFIHNIHDYNVINKKFQFFNIGNNVNLVSSNYPLKNFEKDKIYYPQLNNKKLIHITDCVPDNTSKAKLYRKDIFLYNGIFIGKEVTLNDNCTLIPMFTKHFSDTTNIETKYDKSKNPSDIFNDKYDDDYFKISKDQNKYKKEDKVLTSSEISLYKNNLINYEPIWILPDDNFNDNKTNLFIEEKKNNLHHGIIFIGDNTNIEENTNIYHSVFISNKCIIGKKCTICPHTLILDYSNIENNITFENKNIKINTSDIKTISNVTEINKNNSSFFNIEFKTTHNDNFNMIVYYKQDIKYNPFNENINRIDTSSNKEIYKEFLSCKSVILGNKSKVINKSGHQITILSPFIIDKNTNLIINASDDIIIGPGLIFQNNNNNKNTYEYNINNSIENKNFNKEETETKFLLFKNQEEINSYTSNNLNTSNDINNNLNNLNSSNNLNNSNNLNSQTIALSREDIKKIKNIPSCKQLTNFDNVLNFKKNKYNINDKYNSDKINSTIIKLKNYYNKKVHSGGAKSSKSSKSGTDKQIQNIRLIKRMKNDISKCQNSIENYLNTKNIGYSSISMGTTINSSTDLSKLSPTYLSTLPLNVYSSLTPNQQSYISSLQSSPSLTIQPSQINKQSTTNTISQGQIGRDQLFDLFKNSSNISNKSKNANNNLNNTTKGIEDTDIKTQLEESKNTIKSLIQKFGKPSLSSDSYYQRKLEKVDESLGRLILLEEDVQEYKLGKDKFKDLVGDFSYIVEDMKKDLKDKQLMDSTKKLHEELLQDKDMSKIYKEKLEISESTLLKKINKVVSRGGDIREFNDQFRDIMGSFKLDTFQNLFINLMNKEYNNSTNKTEITSVCRFLDFFEKYTNVENKNFSQKINNLRQNVLRCHGNINKQKGDKKNNRKNSKKRDKRR